jgi:hypothetical protein
MASERSGGVTLSPAQAVALATDLHKVHDAESDHLSLIEDYVAGKHSSIYVPKTARREFQWIVRRARVNVLPLVVDTLAQSLYVVGYRPAQSSENAAPWETWQANRMDARQAGVHRAALTYGIAFVVGLPGDPAPVLRARSPRDLTAVYADVVDDEWPQYALERTPQQGLFRMYDATHVYDLEEDRERKTFRLVAAAEHGFGYCPVVRFLNRYDLDGHVVGEVEPLIPLQDQINFTTFGLLMAQQYSAFRQRWVTGMAVPEDDKGNPIEPLNVAVNRLLVAEDSDTKFGEFGQTDLKGYIDSRESSLRHMATVSQVPPHNLLGQMANLSAEALVAAESGQQRKINERKASFGESWEQVLRMCAALSGDVESANDMSAQVVWRDTEARSLSSTVDALGKLASMLGVPAQELWHQVPGVTSQDVDRWRAAAAENDSLGQFAAMLDRQTQALLPADAPVAPTG